MGRSESDIQQLVQIEAMNNGCNLMRNNSGVLMDANGRPVRYGLGNISKKHNEAIKSSDLVGITTVVITPEMVGRKVGIFTAIEVKEEDWKPTKKLDKHEVAQQAFLTWVTARGGIASFINHPSQLSMLFGFWK